LKNQIIKFPKNEFWLSKYICRNKVDLMHFEYIKVGIL